MRRAQCIAPYRRETLKNFGLVLSPIYEAGDTVITALLLLAATSSVQCEAGFDFLKVHHVADAIANEPCTLGRRVKISAIISTDGYHGAVLLDDCDAKAGVGLTVLYERVPQKKLAEQVYGIVFPRVFDSKFKPCTGYRVLVTGIYRHVPEREPIEWELVVDEVLAVEKVF